jgi:hypothetical protein
MTDPPHGPDLARRAMQRWALLFGVGVRGPLGVWYRIASCLETT